MNVILIVSDTFRYDNLSCYASSPVKTPNLDRLADRAHVFKDSYLGSFPTVPHRLDVMSGRFSFTEYEWCPLPSKVVTLQQVLGASGVVTGLVLDNPHLLEEGYFYSRGFKGFEWVRGQETDTWKTAPEDPAISGVDPRKLRSANNIVKQILRNRAAWRSEEDRYTPRTVRAACNWLEENAAASRFFLQIDLFDPHEPWDAPASYVDLYDPGYDGDDIFYPRYDFWRRWYSEREMAHMRALYMAEATMVDRWLGVLLDKIDELGLSEDTAVIFTSDHGYLFGEHELAGKSLFPERDGRMMYEAIPMYAEIRRTPLLIQMPGQTRGQTVSGLVQPPDLMPTVMEMLGLLSTEAVAGQSQMKALQCGVFVTQDWSFDPSRVHGRSLLPLMRGETAGQRDIAVSSNTLIHHTPVLAKCAVVTSDGWCLHYSGAYSAAEARTMKTKGKVIGPGDPEISLQPALYNLATDPGETNDLFASNEALAAEIHQRYVAWLEEVGTPPEHVEGRRALR